MFLFGHEAHDLKVYLFETDISYPTEKKRLSKAFKNKTPSLHSQTYPYSFFSSPSIYMKILLCFLAHPSSAIRINSCNCMTNLEIILC